MNFIKFKLILISIFILFYGNAQTLKNKRVINSADTIMIFPAIGVIKCYQEGEILPNDSLNNIFLEKLDTILTNVNGYKIVYMSDDFELSDSLKKYFVNTIPKFSTINEDVFSIIPLGESFTKMISNIPGRYFGIIFYNGFLNQRLGKQVAQSLALGISTAILTGGMYAAYTVPQEHYLINDFLLLDKKENCFLYYKRRKQGGPPILNEAIEKNYRKIFESMKQK